MNHIYQVSKIYEQEGLKSEWITGWTYEGSTGLFDSYASALASSMGLWDEYCEFFSTKCEHDEIKITGKAETEVLKCSCGFEIPF